MRCCLSETTSAIDTCSTTLSFSSPIICRHRASVQNRVCSVSHCLFVARIWHDVEFSPDARWPGSGDELLPASVLQGVHTFDVYIGTCPDRCLVWWSRSACMPSSEESPQKHRNAAGLVRNISPPTSFSPWPRLELRILGLINVTGYLIFIPW